MKTKFNFKIDAMKIEIDGRVIETPQVDVQTEVETSVTELKDLYELKKTAFKECPELIEELMLKLASLHKTSMEITKSAKAEEFKQTLKEQTENADALEHESLDEWFKDLFMQKDVDRNLITMYYEFCQELQIKPSVLIKKWGLKLFFELGLNEKREFANRVTQYLVESF